jgi:site-specific recombinase XerD
MPNVNRGTGWLEIDGVKFTASPLKRHRTETTANGKVYPGCDQIGKDKPKCSCPYAILIYNGATKKQMRVSAHTKSLTIALERAEKELDKFDPYKKQLAAATALRVTVVDAIKQFLEQLETKGISESRIRRYRVTLGGVNGHQKQRIDSNLKLADFCARHEIHFINDITSDHLEAWRRTWTLGDQTELVTCGNMMKFFKYCAFKKWCSPDLGHKNGPLERNRMKSGNRTVPFEPEQYEAIVREAGKLKDKRMLAMIELMRWGGMAIIDAVLFSCQSIDAQGVLEYHRAKNASRRGHKPATVTLPKRVVKQVKSLPVTEVFPDKDHPFRRAGIIIDTNKDSWRVEMEDVFQAALRKLPETSDLRKNEGEVEVRLHVKDSHENYIWRAPHPHMLRDTCAVEYLKMGATFDQVADYLGDTAAMVEKHYSAWVRGLKSKRMEQNRELLEKAGLL